MEDHLSDQPDSEEIPSTGVSVREAREVTRERAADFRALLSKYVKRHLPSKKDAKSTDAGVPKVEGNHASMLPLLRLIPWILLIFFTVSFAWDFPEMSFTLMGRVFVLDGLMRIVAVSGLIGFLTNWVAITMLFKYYFCHSCGVIAIGILINLIVFRTVNERYHISILLN